MQAPCNNCYVLIQTANPALQCHPYASRADFAAAQANKQKYEQRNRDPYRNNAQIRSTYYQGRQAPQPAQDITTMGPNDTHREIYRHAREIADRRTREANDGEAYPHPYQHPSTPRPGDSSKNEPSDRPVQLQFGNYQTYPDSNRDGKRRYSEAMEHAEQDSPRQKKATKFNQFEPSPREVQPSSRQSEGQLQRPPQTPFSINLQEAPQPSPVVEGNVNAEQTNAEQTKDTDQKPQQ